MSDYDITTYNTDGEIIDHFHIVDMFTDVPETTMEEAVDFIQEMQEHNPLVDEEYTVIVEE